MASSAQVPLPGSALSAIRPGWRADEAAGRGGGGEVAARVARHRADRAAAGRRALGEHARELRAALGQ